MEGYKGFLAHMKEASNVVTYSVRGFAIDDSKTLMYNHNDRHNRCPTIMVSGYQMVILNNDKEKIAFYKREHRKDYVRKWRKLVSTFGIDIAKVIDWLGKYENHFRSIGYNGDTWEASHLGLVWGDYGRRQGDYDESYVSLIVHMNTDKTFKIMLRGQDGYGYDTPVEKILSSHASYKSVINQVNYFKRKYSKQGV